MKKANDEYIGFVKESLPQTQFRVDVSISDRETKEIICYLSGKMWKNFIKVLPGDKVRVVLSPDHGRGRITRRL